MKLRVRFGFLVAASAVLVTYSTASYAHGTKPGMISKALVQALEDFEDNSTGAVLRRFDGVKGFYDGSQMKVKIYLKRPVEEIRILCDEDHATETIVCREDAAGEGGDGHDDHDH